MPPRNAPRRLEVGDAAEVARFEAKIVRGPGPADCWIWIGSIGDDGYGRFSIQRDGQERIVGTGRYACALYQRPVPADMVAMHDICDNPACVRGLSLPGAPAHLVIGTQRTNLATAASRGRSYGGRPVWHHDGLSRAQRVERSRALRRAVRHGWDADAVAAAMRIGAHPHHHDRRQLGQDPMLFDVAPGNSVDTVDARGIEGEPHRVGVGFDPAESRTARADQPALFDVLGGQDVSEA
ncbi:hypothetical protein [Nocardia neocaledoniensis]|uniref:hypothetical protein n=1 Tax=Nocardia neocaledoniensis TaxID=236511 RepID=UPI00245726CE|nr:hypothetical protein [Nocardia neocaledoniensis]